MFRYWYKTISTNYMFSLNWNNHLQASLCNMYLCWPPPPPLVYNLHHHHHQYFFVATSCQSVAADGTMGVEASWTLSFFSEAPIPEQHTIIGQSQSNIERSKWFHSSTVPRAHSPHTILYNLITNNAHVINTRHWVFTAWSTHVASYLVSLVNGILY